MAPFFGATVSEMLGDHGIYLKGPYFYDCAMRVPLIIRWPKRYRAGLKSDALVELIDLAPTLLEAAGIPAIPGMQGQSLGPLLRGEATEQRDSIYMEHYDSSFLYEPRATATAIRTRRYKLAFYHTLATGELYDLDHDPGEVHNLWHSPASRGVREELLMKLLQRMSQTIDPLPVRTTLA
jgi:arylsulfatase